MTPDLERTQPVEEAQEDIVTLVDEDGKEHEFTVVDIIEVDEKEYALLMPVEGEGTEEDSEDVLVLRFEDDSLVMIEDEQEFNKVVAYLEELGEQIES
jgi:putative Holliday junction resolvase